MEDDYGTSYYYRGAVTNNYVRFGKNSTGQDMYWRIIRINGNGTLRILYDGTRVHDNGMYSDDRSMGWSKWNDNYDDAKYVGYMYGGTNGEASTSKEQAQTNETPSTMKTYLEDWYKTNVVDTGFDNYVSDTLFCNDRSTTSTPSSFGERWGDTGLGYANNMTVYGFWNRPFSPSFKCSQKNDAFTVSDTTVGNGRPSYPVGLITTDEMSTAGGTQEDNKKYYLYKGEYYWTFSPAYFDNVGHITLNGGTGGPNGSTGGNLFFGAQLNNNFSVIPVINLSTKFVNAMSGDGSKTNPYHL